LPYGKFELNARFKKRCKFTPFRRVRPLFNGADHQPGPGAKAVKDVASLKGEPHKTVRGQKEEIADTSLERGLPQEEDKEAKIEIQDKVIFRRDANFHQGYTGQNAEEEPKAVRGRKNN
jgi:hypothetical protein